MSRYPAFDALLRFAARYERVNVKWRRELGISTNERLVLAHLSHEGSLTAADLSKRVGMTSAAMTTLIDRLEAANLVKRVPDQRDRRRILLYPTKHMLQSSQELTESVAREVQAIVESLQERDRRLVQDLLERFGDIFERHASS